VNVALDTNVLVYAEDINGGSRREVALEAGRTRSEARDAVLIWRDAYAVASTEPEVLIGAMDLAVNHQMAIWDAVILSTASGSDCRLLLSEDLQDGFTWGGVTVVNPFADERHPLLEAVLNQG
jgi:predicted nucleic acid-binding protein